MKFNLKSQAFKLRKLGWSVREIAKELNISESTSSLWCREIQLTPQQKKRLEERTGRKLQKFFKLVEKQKLQRKQQKEKLMDTAVSSFGNISNRDRFVAGVALYWAEGFKHISEKRLGFCNSDPSMMVFQIKFWTECLGIDRDQITARLTLNERFISETERIQKEWSEYLNLPLIQFTKPFYQKSKSIKDYGTNNGYRGVLRIHARKSSQKMTEMRGYLKAIASTN